MRVIVGCEFSGIVREAFRKVGHEAYSCDILPPEDHSPHHFQDDVLSICKHEKFDLGIFFPPCTRLTVAGARWFKGRELEQVAAIEFVLDIWHLPIEKLAIENPIGVLSTKWRKPDQIIQPWMFGHGETKSTCIWKRNLPQLCPTDIVLGREPRVHFASPGPDRWKFRSRTLPGIAKAFAEQWG